ncbi:DUF2911 domain-containing protein [Rufibacter latericius]|uniref:DUF2911 domain-containing protein n=1 Tax=Rufibacter latericius TaxID=2487040 RepID=A0A3M9MZX5_9BACT|nr:DUF2911 domain-containing protein [Rufibacter latericius]RNI31026.1 DUF2911 domain-containing protein [Rufibacter latericius]
MKKMLSLNLAWALALAMLLVGTEASAQLQTPAASPSSTVTQVLGLTKVTVDYSRPSTKGRKIFGDLAPYGKIWRTGANASTKITFSDEVMLEGNKVPAGEYALYTIPTEKYWTIIIHKNTKHWGDGGKDYKQEDDVVRFKVTPKKSAEKVETFTIGFNDLTNNGGTMQIMWENTVVPVKITTDVDTKVMAQIQEKVINGTNVTPALYAAAAAYYADTNKDMKQALTWMKQANEKDPKFWTLHQQAKIQAKLKDYKGAAATAQKSIELAKKESNADYVALNEKLLAEIKNK